MDRKAEWTWDRAGTASEDVCLEEEAPGPDMHRQRPERGGKSTEEEGEPLGEGRN